MQIFIVKMTKTVPKRLRSTDTLGALTLAFRIYEEVLEWREHANKKPFKSGKPT